MLSVLPLWILLNTYAFLLDALAMASGAGAWLLFSTGHPILGWAAGLAAAGLLFVALRVHASYFDKLKAYHTLYQRNLKSFHPSSFHDFMGSPCYRLVVRTVLHRTGHPEEYDAIYKKFWGSGFPLCSPKPATVVFFQNAAEGERWLRSNHSVYDDDTTSAESSPDGGQR